MKENNGVNYHKYDLVNIESEIYTNEHVSAIINNWIIVI